jgi:hypothetical protein
VWQGDGARHDEVGGNPLGYPVISEVEKGFGAATTGCGGGTPVIGSGGEGFLKLAGSMEG